MNEINNQLIIRNTAHPYLFPALLICLFSIVIIYNIYFIVYIKLRQKKLLKAAGMIIDGHESFIKNKKDNISSNLEEQQICMNRKKIRDMENRKNATKTRKMKKGKVSLKKKHTIPKEIMDEASLNAIYKESDMFDEAIDLYYAIAIPAIEDADVSRIVYEASIKRKKRTKKQ